MSSKVAAFAEYGVALRNDVWSWSGVTPEGEVVMTLWRDEFSYRSKPISYSNQNSPDFEQWVGANGNIEGIENLKLARDKHDGRFRVIVVVAENEKTYPRTIKEAYAKKNMIMRLIEFDDQTGKFKAELEGADAHRP